MANLDEYYINLKTQTNNQLGLYLFCCSIGVIWTVYVLFFNSRVVGSVFTFLINLYLKRYSKSVWIRIRSLSISFLSGKIMFRGVHYVNIDYMVYIQDGWITFSYWKPQFVKIKENIKEPHHDSNNKNTKDNIKNQVLKRTARLNIFLCNFQLHYYNSWKTDSLISNITKNTNNTENLENDNENNSKFFTSQQTFKKNFSSNSIFNLFANQTNKSNAQGLNNLSNSASNKSTNFGLKSSSINNNVSNNDYNFTEDLMQLFSVVNIRIQKARIFAGNLSLPSTLSIKLSNAKMELVTEKSQSKVDDYCFILKGDLNKLEISFIPNKKINFHDNYINIEKKVENRVLVFRSVSSDFKYVQDVPSILTFDRRYLQKTETGELIQNEKEPQWSLHLNCNKHTIINYGPWFDRQREALWKFFFPQNYEKLEPQPEPTLNERRQTSKFDFSITFKDPNSEINVLFTANNFKFTENFDFNLNNLNDIKKHLYPVEKRLTFKCRAESFLECSIPWLTRQYGYKTTIKGRFNSVLSYTNMSFKELVNADTLNFDIDINYPLDWNDMQTWNFEIELIKSSIFIVFYHKNFFQDLINDWSSRVMGDIRSFVPYVYDINVKAKDIEVVLPCNEHNWIDVHQLENNAFFEILASRAELKLELPFKEFLPEKTNIELDIKVHDACARFIVPPFNNNLILLKILRKNINYVSLVDKCKNKFESKKWSRFNQIDQQSNISHQNYSNKKTNEDNNFQSNLLTNKKQSKSSNKKRSQSNKSYLKSNNNSKQGQKYNKSNSTTSDQISSHFQDNWFECWQTNYVSVVLNFDYHPCCIIDWQKVDLPSVKYYKSLNSPKFNCEVFKPDTIDLKIELGPSNVMLYGTFLKRLWFIKEGYFSWDQFYSDIIDLNDLNNLNNKYDKTTNGYMVSKQYHDIPLQLLASNQKDPRNFRPLSVNLSLAIHNITGHLVLDTTNDVPFPIGFTDRLALELQKTYSETKLQLFVDPINVFIEDILPRSYDQNLSQGHLCLSSIQVRGHAMFSDEGRVKTDTLEYGWLLEILMGELTGSITPIQTEQIIHGVETLITLLLENEFKLQNVFLNRIDPGLPYKYEITRFSLDLIDIYLVESGTALNFNLHPIRLSICNSHTEDFAKGLSACIDEFKLTLFINELSRNSGEYQAFSPLSESNNFSKLAPTSFNNKDRFSNYSFSSISLSSLGSSVSSKTLDGSENTFKINSDISQNGSLCKDLFKSNNIDDTLSENMATLTRDNVDKYTTNNKLPDSNEFNYWFECSSFSSGKIVFDLALEKGNPKEQLEFLRMHDLNTKRLYFLWSKNESTKIINDKIDLTFTQNGLLRRKCGCYGGCSYYSVFDQKNASDFFDLKISITRSNPNFGESLFFPGKHILLSQEIMLEKHDIEFYNETIDTNNKTLNNSSEISKSKTTFGNKLLDPLDITISDEGNDEEFNNSKLDDISIKSIVSNSKIIKENNQSDGSSSKTDSYNSLIKDKESLQKNSSVKSLASTISLYSSNTQNLNNEEDFYTADEQEDSDLSKTSEKRKELRTNTIKYKSSQNNISIKSKISHSDSKSFSSLNKQNIGESIENLNFSNNETLNDNKNDVTQESNKSKNFIRSDFGHIDNNKMALNFDIQRPILDSSLPKYCYLKYLSRVSVSNWNKSYNYPYYQDYKDRNIFFTYRQKGIDFNEVITNSKNVKIGSKKSEKTENNSDLDLQVNCRANLEFSAFECYITPLALTALGRYTQALQSYEISPNSLITELQTKAQTHCANHLITEAISKTQVSVKIPQIRLFSLQCGLAEGDKICDAFINTLANPDEFITLSLFSISLYDIETQLVDSISKTAAIFQIDKIDAQFCRLYESATSNEYSSSIKLSCIPEEYSKTSIKCFKNDVANKNRNIKSLIMYESVFDHISIKAIKKAKELSTPSPNKANQNDDTYNKIHKNLSKVFDINETVNDKKCDINTTSKSQKNNTINRFSLFEFDIAKIWFSFPEPPTSPKGKRKIPYTRHDWNLLSSVSPAVTSWLCASKYSLTPLKEFLMLRNDHVIKNMAALIIGSLKNKEELDEKIDSEFQLDRYSQFKNSNETNFSTRLKNKIGSSSKASYANNLTSFESKNDAHGHLNKNNVTNNYGQRFLQCYLKKSSLAFHRDPNCRLTNIMRNYLFYYEEDFVADLLSENLPEVKYLKRGINEVLNSWTTAIMNYICDFNDQNVTYFRNSLTNNHLFNGMNINFNHENDMTAKSNENFKFFTEIRENKAGVSVSNLELNHNKIKQDLDIENQLNKNEKSRYQPQTESMETNKNSNNQNNIGLKNPVFEANQKLNNNYNIYLNTEQPLLNSNVPSSDESIEVNNSTYSNNNLDENNRNDTVDNSIPVGDKNSFVFNNQDKLLQNDETIDNKALHSGHVGPQLKNTSKIFKPILNFIGIDSPSGTIIDNLFKEFGSLLFGNLNIKSVDINILGKQLKKIDISNSSSSKMNPSSNYEKVITTILSFDQLLLNINVRQVMSKELTLSNNNKLTSQQNIIDKEFLNKPKQESTNMSMINPVYLANLEQNNNKLIYSNQLVNTPKYYTKIDAGIQLNNLTQEVNMPLLRLIHQLYSIVADAIEYDKEQNKVIDKFNTNNIQPRFNFDTNNNSPIFIPNTKTIKFINRDCWRFMDQILELRDFVPEPKYVETNEIWRKNSQKNHQKYVHITKDIFFKEKSLISIFGWIFIRRINSKAGLGTLAFGGEMNNVQISALLDRKIGSSLKTQYEGSFNMRMDSTIAKLIENDSKQNVVQMFVGKSHLFGYFKNFNINNLISSFIHVGQIYIDVPLRPMVVHGVVYRESKVIEQNILPEIKNFVIFENQDESSSNIDNKEAGSSQVKIDDIIEKKILADKTDYVDNKSNPSGPLGSSNNNYSSGSKIKQKGSFINTNKSKKKIQQHEVKIEQDNIINKFTFQLKSKLDGCEIRAKLLENPCLKAAYLINNIECNALIKNEKSKVSCFLSSHCLSFQCDDDMVAQPSSNGLNLNSQNDVLLLASYKRDELLNSFDGMMNMKPLEERTNFFLPSVSLNGSHLSKHIQLEALFNNTNSLNRNSTSKTENKNLNSKLLNLIEVLFLIKISPLNRELNAQVIAQLVFVTKVFIKEMNHILLAVYGLDNTSNISTKPTNLKKAAINTNASTALNSSTIISRFYYDFKIEMGRISLTGITPSNTALTIFTGEKSTLILKNNFKNNIEKNSDKFSPENEHTLKPSIEAKCDFSVELKTLFNISNDKDLNETDNSLKNNNSFLENNNNWYQLAYFNTKFDLRNAVRTVNSHLDRESIIITVEKPRFYLQPGAVDCALLFWLNYKSTYEFWLQQRQQFANFLIDQEFFTKNYNPQIIQNDEKFQTSHPNTNSSPNETNYLALKLRVTGLGVALPLSNKMSQDFFKTNTDCLVISLSETVIYACSSGCVVSKGQFSNFSMRFTENFNLASSEWSPPNFQDPRNLTISNNYKYLMNAWIVPSGNYEICSSTIEKPKYPINNSKLSPIWILSVKWKMEGIEVNLDTNVGKWLSKLADTVTRLAETQNINENNNNIDQDSEIKKLKKELNFYIEKGDNNKINSIQSRIDMLNLASYPERAKQMFVKTRNNLKGQLGFNTNHLATPSKTMYTNKLSQLHSESIDSADSTLTPDNIDPTQINLNNSIRRHSRTKSEPFASIFSFLKSAPNDDTHMVNASRNYITKKQECVIEENENELSTSNQNDKEKYNNQSSVHHSQLAATSAPAIDFKLNVKIEINSGKCILHANNNKPNTQKSNEHLASNTMTPLANYFATNLNDYQRNAGLINTFMQNGINKNIGSSDQDMRNTNFIFPAIGVKAFYESTHKEINKRLSKKANLYAMIKLESFVMPHSYPHHLLNHDLYNSRDMCISPALLDFLEQTLEPFDMIKASFESATATTPGLSRFNRNYLVSSEESKQTEHPIEQDNLSKIIGNNNNKENTDSNSSIETNEQPAYFPVDVVVFVSMLPSSIRFTCLPHSTMECLLKLPTLEMVFSTNRLESHYQESLKHKLNSNDNYEDLFKSFKNSNSSFYKGSNSKKINNLTSTNEGGLSITCSMTDFSLKFYNRLAIRNQVDSRFYYSDHSSYTEDKDSLSVRVAYIKVNISRSRRVTKITESLDESAIGSSLNDVKLSVLADIGSSSFTYDMRNIKEVFVFPKIWYRRSLARRLFLGEETSIRVNDISTNSKSDKGSSDSIIKIESKISSDKLDKGSFARPKTLSLNNTESSNENIFLLNNSWKTLVLISVNLVGLEIKMNVGNIMGNVCLLTKNARLTSKISISRFGPKDMLFNFALDNARLIAEGGSNGCLLRIQDITSSIEINDKNKQTKCPFHKIDFLIYATECRIDSAYNQASPILAFRLSNLSLKLGDSWTVSSHALNYLEGETSNKLPEALIELNVTWDQLHLMITRSTTPDLIMLYYKLMDFFEKQFTESKDYIKECELDLFYEIKVKQQFIEKKETLVKKNFNVNGGCIQLKGNNFTLITFHGNNFKAKKWAVFSLNEPSMDFASQTYNKNGEFIQQNLGFYLGRNERKKDMASIYMVYRDSTSIFTRFQTINEWFEYAHSSIDAVGLRDFPRFSSDIHPLLLNQPVKKSKMNDQTKWEEIFHLPSLQIFCDTTQENNIVKFEFKTDFHDHIQLTFRTELFGFLHELITSYIKEKDLIKDKEEFIPVSKKDDRVYECTRWDLEPTLRLISKFGSSVEPSGVDGLLKSLGFHHARSTIPKWFQRGLLDNLHDVLHNIIRIYAKMISDYDVKNLN